MLWGVISLAMVIVFNLFSQPQHSSQPSVTYSEFLRQAAKGEVSEVVIQGNTLTGKTTDGKSFQIYVPNDPGLVDKLIAEKVEVRAEPVEDSPWYMTLLVSWFPMLLLIGVWIFFMRQMQGGAGRAMSFGRSRARMLNQEQGKVTFDDVAGVDEAKEEAARIIQRANEEAELSKKRAMDEVKQEMITVASMMAAKVVAANIDATVQDTLVEETLKEMGESTWQS